eukprot:Sspe_Gene.106095::Locus_83294_Transcript_1_1_Confidence_1.000_Length_1115::g.106095::m.106095
MEEVEEEEEEEGSREGERWEELSGRYRELRTQWKERKEGIKKGKVWVRLGARAQEMQELHETKRELLRVATKRKTVVKTAKDSAPEAEPSTLAPSLSSMGVIPLITPADYTEQDTGETCNTQDVPHSAPLSPSVSAAETVPTPTSSHTSDLRTLAAKAEDDRSIPFPDLSVLDPPGEEGHTKRKEFYRDLITKALQAAEIRERSPAASHEASMQRLCEQAMAMVCSRALPKAVEWKEGRGRGAGGGEVPRPVRTYAASTISASPHWIDSRPTSRRQRMKEYVVMGNGQGDSTRRSPVEEELAPPAFTTLSPSGARSSLYRKKTRHGMRVADMQVLFVLGNSPFVLRDAPTSAAVGALAALVSSSLSC